MNMRWLLWKDYRHNRLIVFTALFLLLAPHLLALFGACKLEFLGNGDGPQWPEFFLASSVYSLSLCQLAVALIGGNAIAGERVDRSEEFLFSLPITRRKLLTSKLLLALLIIAAPWMMNAPALGYLVGTLPSQDPEVVAELLTNTAITGLTFFCVAWFLSSFIASPTFAVCGGLVTPLLFGTGFYLVCGLLDVSLAEDELEVWYRTFCLTLAPPCFALGTWHYLRRVEP